VPALPEDYQATAMEINDFQITAIEVDGDSDVESKPSTDSCMMAE